MIYEKLKEITDKVFHVYPGIKIGEKFIETKEKSSPSPIRFAYSSLKKGGEEND